MTFVRRLCTVCLSVLVGAVLIGILGAVLLSNPATSRLIGCRWTSDVLFYATCSAPLGELGQFVFNLPLMFFFYAPAFTLWPPPSPRFLMLCYGYDAVLLLGLARFLFWRGWRVRKSP